MADNVYWSSIFLGNLAEMDTDESTFTVETADPLLTTFGAGAGNALANNIVTIETDAGTFDTVVDSDGKTDESPDLLTYDLGAGPVTTQIDATLLVDATVTFFDQTTLTLAVAVIQDTSGNAFLLIRDSQPELASQGLDQITFNFVIESNYSGVTQAGVDDFTFVCLTSGCLVDTPKGRLRMDRLRCGDLITTLDNGPQPIVWIGKRRKRFAARSDPDQPIRIAKHALGPNLPLRDTLVSPQHRILTRTSAGYALHDPLGALAPAKALTRHKGIRALPGRREITYFSLLLPRHEVIVVNGIATESLYPGPEVFARLTAPERTVWMQLAGRGARVTGMPPARVMLSVAEARAAYDAKLLTLPDTAPAPLKWSYARSRHRPQPNHLAHRA